MTISVAVASRIMSQRLFCPRRLQNQQSQLGLKKSPRQQRTTPTALHLDRIARTHQFKSRRNPNPALRKKQIPDPAKSTHMAVATVVRRLPVVVRRSLAQNTRSSGIDGFFPMCERNPTAKLIRTIKTVHPSITWLLKSSPGERFVPMRKPEVELPSKCPKRILAATSSAVTR